MLRSELGSSLKGGKVPMRTGTGEVQRSKALTMMVMKGDKVHFNLLMLLKDLFEK